MFVSDCAQLISDTPYSQTESDLAAPCQSQFEDKRSASPTDVGPPNKIPRANAEMSSVDASVGANKEDFEKPSEIVTVAGPSSECKTKKLTLNLIKPVHLTEQGINLTQSCDIKKPYTTVTASKMT